MTYCPFRLQIFLGAHCFSHFAPFLLDPLYSCLTGPSHFCLPETQDGVRPRANGSTTLHISVWSKPLMIQKIPSIVHLALCCSSMLSSIWKSLLWFPSGSGKVTWSTWDNFWLGTGTKVRLRTNCVRNETSPVHSRPSREGEDYPNFVVCNECLWGQ